MTIAISVKVHDGVVLAADSATTLYQRNPETGKGQVVKVYANATKVYELQKGLPIGAVTWGDGAIGSASIATLIKDFSQQLKSASGETALDPKNYTIEDVSKRVSEFLSKEYTKLGGDLKPELGLLIAGYATTGGLRAALPDLYRILFENTSSAAPVQVRKNDECGVNPEGQREAVARLVDGFSPALRGHLEKYIEASKDLTVDILLEKVREPLAIPLVQPPMPIQDAIDLAGFLCDTACGYSRFAPEDPVVGGPIEIAAITKHEGFRWVRRKYFYDRALNDDPTSTMGSRGDA